MPSSPLNGRPGLPDPPPESRPEGPPPGRRPAARRRRRRLAVTLSVALALTVTVVLRIAPTGDRPTGVAPAGRAYDDTATQPGPAYPTAGVGSFAVAGGQSPVRGLDGPVVSYRVAVEQGAGQDPDAFATEVDTVLGDPRSWIGSGELRVRRVDDPEYADFTVYLATPATSEAMCATGGLSTEGYTSCRLPGEVVINLARWSEAVPDYGAPLAVYRAYVINHEVGHEFGEGHQACPGPGRPAPVMQQQTYGLDGCRANAWPFLDGVRYAGDPAT
ncbi:DUF3152 domain-containing protein [Micromonospora craniellae]|uniref:DUF3152 domain-containing protein n=1 Tax=Micromonospora craniellae TaxID=2294034 RepID=A0A372G5Y7_9ACTN|nr:DUF3152 domain-containing protein [Micromonospora craniellae]QOC90214.1 DUF3152 domain-containing protein [Micromonospora craniellae]RFS48398.1 DUF3152 domain-containing protein [Micromonospora craniellae]